MTRLAPYAKALASMVVCAAAYLVGVLPAEGSLGDVSTAQWLGLIVFTGSAFGITYGVPNRQISAGRRRAPNPPSHPAQ